MTGCKDFKRSISDLLRKANPALLDGLLGVGSGQQHHGVELYQHQH